MLGCKEVRTSYRNVIPMRSFNEISAPQQMTHLFKYHTVFNATGFLDDMTMYSISGNRVSFNQTRHWGHFTCSQHIVPWVSLHHCAQDWLLVLGLLWEKHASLLSLPKLWGHFCKHISSSCLLCQPFNLCRVSITFILTYQ